MKLIFLYGPPAVGKLTVAKILQQKIGYKLPIETNFKNRRPSKKKTGIIASIIRLEGLYKMNKYTESRGIYLLGTNHGVGIPKSIGCIGMTPLNVVDLFDSVNVGTKVEIIK